MAEPLPESPTSPFAVRLGLMVLLPILAAAIYLDGQRYDPDLVEFAPRGNAAGPDASLLGESIAGMPRAGQVRGYDEETLYEYINGHAEYFIGAGFRGLLVGEYGDTGDGQPALVVNLHDMGKPLNAFGVLVDEAGDQQSVEVGAMGFRSLRGLSFILGPYYVQMSLFGDGLSAETAGADLARGLAETVDGQDLAFRFPDLGTVTGTRFVKES